MKRFAILLTAAVFTFVSAAWADAPKLINFQGRLADGSGNPVANGSYSVTFRIYNAPTGGSVQWSETQTVSTIGGIFNVLLGSATALPGTVFDDTTRYLAIQVSPDPEMSPRQRLATVGYSFASNPWGTLGSDVFKLNGYVGIGTQSPQVSLHIRQTTSSPVVRFADTNNEETEVGRVNTPWFGLTNPFIIQNLFAGSGVNDMVFTPTVNNPARGIVIKGNTGNVGIGTANPTHGLHIKPQDLVSALALQSGNQANVQMRFLNSAGDIVYMLGTQTQGSGTPQDAFSIVDWTKGVYRIHIDSSGKVGIGTTSPTKKLEVAGSIKVGANDTVFSSNLSSNSPLSLQAPAGTTRMYIDDISGKVGVGTSTPVGKLEVKGSSSGVSEELINLKNSSGAYLGTLAATLGTGDGQLLLHQWTGGATSLGNVRIGATGASYLMGGNLGIGTTTPGDKLEVAGNIKVKLDGAPSISVQSTDPAGHHYGWVSQGVNGSLTLNDFTAGTIRLAIDNAGNAGIGTTSPAALLHVNGSAGNNTGVWSNLSDERLKTSIEPIRGALGTVEKLRGVSFQWKDSKKDAEYGRVRGLIAQDVEKVIPEWVKTDPDGYKRLEPIGIDVLLIEAIKEQQKEIEKLKDKIEKLEKKNRQAKIDE